MMTAKTTAEPIRETSLMILTALFLKPHIQRIPVITLTALKIILQSHYIRLYACGVMVLVMLLVEIVFFGRVGLGSVERGVGFLEDLGESFFETIVDCDAYADTDVLI